jgi:hypothetical protein
MKRIATVTILFAAAVGLFSMSALAVEPAGNLTQSEVKALIQTAKTPADHTRLANYYRSEASRLEAEAKVHEEMAAAYDKNPAGHPIPKGQTLGTHCRNLTKDISNEAKEAGEMAAMHEEMARNAK